MSKTDLEKLIESEVDFNFVGLKSDNIIILKIPKGWKIGEYESNTGYVLITMFGPIELIKGKGHVKVIKEKKSYQKFYST